jgi:hypothetical protein
LIFEQPSTILADALTREQLDKGSAVYSKEKQAGVVSVMWDWESP